MSKDDWINLLDSEEENTPIISDDDDDDSPKKEEVHLDYQPLTVPNFIINR